MRYIFFKTYIKIKLCLCIGIFVFFIFTQGQKIFADEDTKEKLNIIITQGDVQKTTNKSKKINSYSVKNILLLYNSFYKHYKMSSSENEGTTFLFVNKVKTLSKILPYYPKVIDKAILLSILFAYHRQIIDIKYEDNNAAFLIHKQWIYYADGRMAYKTHLAQASKFRKLFYPYSLASLGSQFKDLPEPWDALSTPRLSDFQIALLGLSQNIPEENSRKLQDFYVYVAEEMKEYEFLGAKTRVHTLVGEALKKIDKELVELRKKNKEIDTYLKKIRRTSGYVNRNVKNSTNISMHALGLAFDIIPYTYEGLEAYWLWVKEKEYLGDKWKRVPLEERWNVPNQLVVLFEKHGIIWGGKWPNFDTIHFEYRPELIWYAYIRDVQNIIVLWANRNNIQNNTK